MTLESIVLNITCKLVKITSQKAIKNHSVTITYPKEPPKGRSKPAHMRGVPGRVRLNSSEINLRLKVSK